MPVAANVDQVVVVFAAAKPEPHPRMLDRFLVIAEANELPTQIVINKVELVGEGAALLVRRALTAAGLEPDLETALPRFLELYDEPCERLRQRASDATGRGGLK